MSNGRPHITFQPELNPRPPLQSEVPIQMTLNQDEEEEEEEEEEEQQNPEIKHESKHMSKSITFYTMLLRVDYMKGTGKKLLVIPSIVIFCLSMVGDMVLPYISVQRYPRVYAFVNFVTHGLLYVAIGLALAIIIISMFSPDEPAPAPAAALPITISNLTTTVTIITKNSTTITTNFTSITPAHTHTHHHHPADPDPDRDPGPDTPSHIPAHPAPTYPEPEIPLE